MKPLPELMFLLKRADLADRQERAAEAGDEPAPMITLT